MASISVGVHRRRSECAGGNFSVDSGLPAILTSTIANRFMGETATRMQWVGLVTRSRRRLLVLHDRDIVLAGSTLGWIASFLSLIGITLGTLYQERYCGGMDWRSGNLVRYVGAGALFAFGAFAFETREIHRREARVALAWLVCAIIAAVRLMYWLIRRSPVTVRQPLLSCSGSDGLVRLPSVWQAAGRAFDPRDGDLAGGVVLANQGTRQT